VAIRDHCDLGIAAGAIGKGARARAARVEGAGLRLGGIGAEQLLLTAIGHDAEADVVALSFQRLQHRIAALRAMYVERGGAPSELGAGRPGGAHRIVQFTTALEVPPA
jgi:hypothetical protein